MVGYPTEFYLSKDSIYRSNKKNRFIFQGKLPDIIVILRTIIQKTKRYPQIQRKIQKHDHAMKKTETNRA